jgi:tetratricopeptide (TPR) repeat protein
MESDPAAAVRYAHEGLQRLHTVPNPSAATEAAILGALADAERISGHLAAAEDYFRQSLQQFARSGREYGPDATVIRNNLALAYDATGNPKHALQVFNEILDSAARNQSGALPVAMVANRARTLELIGRFEESKTGYDHCIELSVKGEQPIMRVLCLAGIAWLMRETGDVNAAERYLHEATELARSATPAQGPHQIVLAIARGRIALANNQLSTARASLDAALAAGNTVFFQMTALVPRAELNLKQGQLGEAEADARKALSLAQGAQGGVPRSYRTGMAWLVLGKVLAKKGDSVEGRAALLAAIDHLSNTVDPDHPLLLLARQLVQG